MPSLVASPCSCTPRSLEVPSTSISPSSVVDLAGGVRLRVARVADLIVLKLAAAGEPARRPSKREHDVADVLALLEEHPELAPLFLGFVLLFQLRNHRRIGERRGVTWCKNCLTMDKTTFAIADVKTALNGYVKIKIQAEDMDAEPVKSLLSRFNAVACQPTWCLARLTRRPRGRRAGARSQNSANCTSTRPALGQNP